MSYNDLPREIQSMVMMHRGWLCLGSYTGATSSVGKIHVRFANWRVNAFEVASFWSIHRDYYKDHIKIMPSDKKRIKVN